MSNLSKLEVMLFLAGEPIKKKKIMGTLNVKEDELNSVISELKEKMKDGVCIIDDGINIALATSNTLSSFVDKFKKDETEKILSKASQETLSIICYAGPISKIDLDFLRGVNTQYTIRRLSMRGLVQDVGDKKYGPTTEFLLHMNIENVSQLDDYENIRNKILEGLENTKLKINNQS